MTLLWVVWAGFAASALTAAVFVIARAYRLTIFSPATQLGCLVLDDPRLPMADTVGLAAHLALGSTVVPALYALVLPWLGGPGWVSGMLLGLLHGGAVIAALPRLANGNRAVRAGRLPHPGRWGSGWGRHTALVIVGSGVLYGAVTGAILGAARTQPGAKLAGTTHRLPHLVAKTVQAPLHVHVYGSNQMFSPIWPSSV
jgi:hypothetical protein